MDIPISLSPEAWYRVGADLKDQLQLTPGHHTLRLQFIGAGRYLVVESNEVEFEIVAVGEADLHQADQEEHIEELIQSFAKLEGGIVDHMTLIIFENDITRELEEIGAPAVTQLIEALKHSNKHVRRHAAFVLGNIGDQRALEPLLELCRREDARGDNDVFEPASYAVTKLLYPERAEDRSWLANHVTATIAKVLASYGLNLPTTWGMPIDGVSVRVDDIQLQSGTTEWSHPVATFVYSATNMGPYELHFPENGKLHQIKVDGQWYEWEDFGSFEITETNIYVSKISRLLMFDSGKGFTNQTIQVAGNWRAIPDGKAEEYASGQYSGFQVSEEDYGEELVLLSGKHQIRIAVLSWPVGTNLAHRVRAVSDPFEVNIPGQLTSDPDESDYTLEAKISSTRLWQRGRTITIQSDGTYTFEMQMLRAVPGEDRLVPNEDPYVAEYRLSPGDMTELERLIQATDGLKMEEPIRPPVRDATEYAMTLTLASGQTQRVVSYHQVNPDAYNDLVLFIARIERQEELLYGVLYDENPYHIADSLMNELDAFMGAPNRLMPIAPALDYHRLVPAYSALLEQVDTSAQVMIAGIKLIGFLKLESHRKTLESILLNASEDRQKVRAEAAVAISRMGVARSMEVMKAAIEDQTAPIDAIAEALISAPSNQSLPILEKLAARSQGAAWALIRTPESQETILKLLYQSGGDNAGGKAAYNIIRMYYDHWNDSKFRPSPPVLSAIHDKVMEATEEGSSNLREYGRKVINLSGEPFVIRNAWQQLNDTLLLMASKDQERRKTLLLKEHFRDNEPAEGFMQDAANGELSVRQVYADALYSTGMAYMVGAQGKNHYVVRLAMKSGIAWAMEDAQRVEPQEVQAKLERYLVNNPEAKEVSYDDAPKRVPADERAKNIQSIVSVAQVIMTAVQERDFDTLHRLSAGSLIGWVQPEEAQELNQEIPDGWSTAALEQGVGELLQMYEARPRLLTEFNGVEVKNDWAGIHAYGPRGKLYDPELVVILKRIDGQWRLVNFQQAQKTLAEDLEQSADRFLELEARLQKLREIRAKQQASSVWGEVSNGLQCRLLPLEQELEPSDDGSSVYVTYELRNVGDYAVTFLPWYCPLEGVAGGNVFSILDEDGSQAAYLGKYLERMTPTKESFITIAPGQTVTNRVALPYDFTKPGTYRILAVRPDLANAAQFYYDNDASAIAANPDHVWTGKLVSNEVEVKVFSAGQKKAYIEATDDYPRAMARLQNAVIPHGEPTRLHELLAQFYHAGRQLPRAAELAEIKLLINESSDIDARDSNGLSALHWAARTAQTEVVKLLIDAGADVNAMADKGWTPLHYAFDATLTAGESKKRVPQVIDLLLKAGADPFADLKPGWDSGLRPIQMGGIRSQNISTIVHYLDEPANLGPEMLESIRLLWTAMQPGRDAALKQARVAVESFLQAVVNNDMEAVKESIWSIDPERINEDGGERIVRVLRRTYAGNLNRLQMIRGGEVDRGIAAFKVDPPSDGGRGLLIIAGRFSDGIWRVFMVEDTAIAEESNLLQSLAFYVGVYSKGLMVQPAGKDPNQGESTEYDDLFSGLASDDARERFLAVERFARLPKNDQTEHMAEFYRRLPSRTLSMIVEGILSSYPHDILSRRREDETYDGNTELWAQQLADAASDLSADEIADKLEISLWMNVASRVRALWVFKQHFDTIESLLTDDLDSGDLLAIERAAGVIQAINLAEFTERLLEIWIDEDLDETSPIWSALIFMDHSSILSPLLKRVEEDPQLLIRCAGLFQGPLAGKPAEPLLLNLFADTDPEIRYGAAYALMECVDERLAQPMEKLANESESRFRLIAAHQIPLLPEEAFASVRDQLLSLLNDPDDEVRFNALLGFGKRKDLAAGPIILDVLKREQIEEQYKVWTMQALSALSGSTWNYDMHTWGPKSSRNQEAIEQFEFWLRDKLCETISWGNPNGGLAVRLRPDYPPLEKGEMLFQLDAKSSSETDIMLARLLESCWLEVDGEWYSYVLVYDGKILQPSRLEAGMDILGFEVLRLSSGVNRNWLGGIAGEDGMIPQTLNAAATAGLTHSLDLTPGKHTIRLAYIADPGKVREEQVYAYSNPVVIAVGVKSEIQNMR
ncbi:MAG: HEAT repeat domain-containing protein [Pontiellaceae bacterium]|nr:HEAT repeat domain-containing protein [Pontiellaceae bacterium]